MNIEKTNIPTSARTKANQRYRNHQSDIDAISRKLKTLSAPTDRKQLFGDRYTDDPEAGPRDSQLEQRQQLLSGTERLGRSGERLRESQRIALETEAIGASTLADLHGQRNVIENTHRNLQQSEGYVDRSVKTLRGMARRYVRRDVKPQAKNTNDLQDGHESTDHNRNHYRTGLVNYRSHLQQVQMRRISSVRVAFVVNPQTGVIVQIRIITLRQPRLSRRISYKS